MKDFPQRVFCQIEGSFSSTRITKAACAQGEMDLAGSLVNHPFIYHRSIRVEEIERDRSSTHVSVVRAVDLHQRHTIAMVQRQKCIEQPTRQTPHSFVDRFHTYSLEVFQTNLDRGKIEIVHCA